MRMRIIICTAFVLFGAFSAYAQTGPPILNPVDGGSCLDGDDWDASCFSDISTNPNCTGLTGDQLSQCQCSSFLNSCLTSCAQAETSAEIACYKIADPVSQGNCVVDAQMNWQSCQNQCYASYSSGFCH